MQSALSLLKKDEELQKQPAIVAALDETRKNQTLAAADREVAEAIYQGKKLGELESASAPTRQLDYPFFVDRVQPILESRGKDGNACVYCHSTHTIFKLIPPTETSRTTEAQLRENYRYALRVVNLAEPETSLLLRKPTSDAQVEGTLGAQKLSHGGGIRWEVNSAEYKTILDWINGAAVPSSGK